MPPKPATTKAGPPALDADNGVVGDDGRDLPFNYTKQRIIATLLSLENEDRAHGRDLATRLYTPTEIYRATNRLLKQMGINQEARRNTVGTALTALRGSADDPNPRRRKPAYLRSEERPHTGIAGGKGYVYALPLDPVARERTFAWARAQSEEGPEPAGGQTVLPSGTRVQPPAAPRDVARALKRQSPYTHVSLHVPTEWWEQATAAAQAAGESLTEYVREAVTQRIFLGMPPASGASARRSGPGVPSTPTSRSAQERALLASVYADSVRLPEADAS